MYLNSLNETPEEAALIREQQAAVYYANLAKQNAQQTVIDAEKIKQNNAEYALKMGKADYATQLAKPKFNIPASFIIGGTLILLAILAKRL